MLQKLKNRIFEILDATTSDKLPTRIFDVFIITLIFLNVLAVIVETVESLSSEHLRRSQFQYSPSNTFSAYGLALMIISLTARLKEESDLP